MNVGGFHPKIIYPEVISHHYGGAQEVLDIRIDPLRSGEAA